VCVCVWTVVWPGTCVHVVLEQKLTSTRESKYEGIVAALLNPDDYTILYYAEGRV